MPGAPGADAATTGAVAIDYRDNLATVGARFTGDPGTGGLTYHNVLGFSEVGNVFTSDDYGTATDTYTVDCETTTGGIVVYGTSL